MGRSIKAKAGKGGAAAAQKRRKKGAVPAGGSSPALSAASSSGTSTPHTKECEQCGNPLLLEGVARAWPTGKKSAVSTGCQICDFVAFRRSQRPCVQCARTSCDHFCEWCGKGFHARCARLHDEDVNNVNGFCCRRCESEQSDGHDTDEEENKDEEDVGSRCGSCREPFSSTGKDEDGKLPTGFKVNQAVLVDNEEVLYNALITEVDAKGERIKIHFTRWSKSFDDWYNMDDEHINESLACDCCNQWFHIGCLPPIKSSGRWKDSTYVCPRCIDDARAFHNGNRSVLKEKAAYISTSKAISANAKAAKKGTSPKESDNAPIAVAKSKKPSKAPVVVDDDDEDMEEEHEAKEEDNEKEEKASRAKNRRKRKLSEAAESAGDAETKESEQPESSEAIAMDKAVVASSASMDGGATAKPSTEASAKEPATAKEDATDTPRSDTALAANNASQDPVDANDSGKEPAMHASPEHTVRAVTEAHSSPSKAASSKIGAAKQQNDDSKVDKQAKTAPESDARKRRNVSSCNSVMSILNSPPTNENPAKGFKPTVTSLPMLNPSTTTTATSASAPKTSKGIQPNLPVYVKKEQKNGQFQLYPKAMAKLASQPGQPSSAKKETAVGPQKPTKAVPRGTKRGHPGAAPGSRGSSLSAFDILREVASQSIGDDTEENAGASKPKREKRVSTSRTNNANKRVKTDASTSTTGTSASPGRTAQPGTGHHVPDAAQQSRDRIQMNSFVDLHFSIRKEMYLRFCRLEEEGMLTRDSAHVLRSLIYPTSDRFQDLKFVYLVNKDLPSVQLTKRLLEAVPYPPVPKPLATPMPHANGALRSPMGSKNLGLPVSMGMFSAGLNRASSSTGATHMNLLPPPPGSTLLRPEPPRAEQPSRVASASATAPQRATVGPSASTTTASAPAKRPEMLTTIMEQLAPTHRPVSNPPQPPQQQQQQQRLLNSR